MIVKLRVIFGNFRLKLYLSKYFPLALALPVIGGKECLRKVHKSDINFICFVSALRKDFETPPYSTHIEVGSQGQLICHPPRGRPQVRINLYRAN